MTVPTVSCTNCGKNFTTDDLRGTSCRSCGMVLAHHARAAEQVAVINQMMADRNGNGIPDAYEGLVAGAQASAMGHAFGHPYGQTGPGPIGPGPMMGPANQIHAANMQVAAVTRTVSTVAMVVVGGVVLLVLLMVGGGIAAALLLR